ncbi:MAG: site-2 protease family protein, partial [Candidatus Paceibacterota bacterium]
NFRDQRWGELWVAIAGPVTNISIAIVFGLFLRFTLPLDTLSPAVVQISVMIVLINIVLALFNMIPVPPLDGSKVLFAFLPARYYGIRRFMEQYSFILIIAVIFILFSTNILGYAIFTVFGMLVGDPQILFQTLNALF